MYFYLTSQQASILYYQKKKKKKERKEKKKWHLRASKYNAIHVLLPIQNCPYLGKFTYKPTTTLSAVQIRLHIFIFK